LWHRSFAAGDSLCSLRLPHSVKRVDVRARRPMRPAAAGAGRLNMLEEKVIPLKWRVQPAPPRFDYLNTRP
jgi:hypothetical protein